jgi:hypothetical protein
MNKRIEELMFEAGKYADENTGSSIRSGMWMYQYTEKFAELIIKECSNVCLTDNVSNLDLELIRKSGKFTVQDLATRSCGENLSINIKKHFGVE